MSLMLITGIVMFIVLTWCLLKNSFPPGILFIILPTLAALVCGFGFRELGDYVALGLKSVVGTATLVASALVTRFSSIWATPFSSMRNGWGSTALSISEASALTAGGEG